MSPSLVRAIVFIYFHQVLYFQNHLMQKMLVIIIRYVRHVLNKIISQPVILILSAFNQVGELIKIRSFHTYCFPHR